LLRFKIEEACVALDANAVRAARANLVAASPGQTWGDWADAIAWLVEPTSGEEAAQRALALAASGELRFPGAPRFLREKVRAAALLRAMQLVIAEKGRVAVLSDGRPVGVLALEAGDFEQARALLTAACEADDNSNARWLGYLGEASWRLGDRHAAMQCWCRASLIEPSDIDSTWLTAGPVIELLDLHDDLELSDLPLSYLAVLADLQGQHPLDDFALEVPANASTPRRLAALLRAYRRDRARGALDEAARIEAKRAMARLAPAGLRELLRPL
jgi:tetratricopeptide (TPR) repeat protein